MYNRRTRSLLVIGAWLLITQLCPVFSAQGSSRAPQAQEGHSDSEYNVLVREGIKLEEQGKLKEALEKFRRAWGVKRYEIPSYYVLLHIGRLQYKLGQYVEAVNSLEEYLRVIEIELRVERGEMMPPGGLIIPGYTEQGMKLLLQDKAEAETLLLASKSRLQTK